MEASFDEGGYASYTGLTVGGQTVSRIIYTWDEGSLTLYNLELGNNKKIKTGQIEQSNVGGEVYALKQDYWPIIYELSFTFNNVKNCPDINTIVEFLAAAVGRRITLADHEGLYWDGCIMNPHSELVRNYRDSITINFEGVLT